MLTFKQDMISRKKRTIEENVFIFDEAQRVWDAEQLKSWFIKKGADKSLFGLSEADLLISALYEAGFEIVNLREIVKK